MHFLCTFRFTHFSREPIYRINRGIGVLINSADYFKNRNNTNEKKSEHYLIATSIFDIHIYISDYFGNRNIENENEKKSEHDIN